MIKKILSSKISTAFISSYKKIQHRQGLRMLTHRTPAFFSQNQKLPKSKQEAWMMQQQKNLKKSQLDDQQSDPYYTGITKVGVAGIVIGLSAIFYMIYSTKKKSQQNLGEITEDISGLIEIKQRQSAIGGQWTLTDTNGKPFSSHNLRGYYYLMYFGFSNCPIICPNILYSIGSIYRIIRNLPEGAYVKLKVVFVSIDPERDTPNVLKEFLKNFGKNIIGVTALKGDQIQLKQCMKKFGIKSKKIDQNPKYKKDDKDYNIDHTSHVFLMDPHNVYLYHLEPNLTQQQSAKKIVSKIVQNEHRISKLEQKFNSQ